MTSWRMFDERKSHGVMKDAAPFYKDPTGPTRVALAYAENPLAIFYFFLPKELWRKVADETDQYRRDSIDEAARGMRARAQQKRLKVKLQRKNAIQPHEIVRFIGLLIARTLEPRRASLSRHWVTKVEGALARGTFSPFLSRDRFHDIARYLHFNENELQAKSGDRAFKSRSSAAEDILPWLSTGSPHFIRREHGSDAPPPQPNAAVHADEAKQVGDQVLLGMLC
ncbi:hypothetical protein ON010_g18387 [Phytophthora cinnamomi]|nr:hypothetical protein ON010_g18387 [Phytophthora cinnamomi]